jgi:aminoglycoside phosphotransferase (APT) family kinase protein
MEPIVHSADLDADWLTAALTGAGVLTGGARVTGVTREVCGTGQLADSYRFTLDYDRPGAGPATLVGKFPSDDATSRAFGQQSGYYKHEVRFYEQVAPRLTGTVAVPTPVYAALAANETDFVLLMADLSPARVIDQLVGATADEAAATVEQVAALHAATWHDAALAGLDWLQGTATSFVHVTDNFAETTGTFREKFGDLIPADQVEEAARLNRCGDAWKAVFTEPQCLWHSDLRADNLLFEAASGAMPVALLDWQGVGYGRGTIDLAYFLGTSLTTDVRRTCERDVVALYHRALVGHGVQGYSADECWSDYRVAALHTLQVGVFGLGAVKRSARGDEMWRVWIDRGAAQVRDLDSYAALLTRE